MVKSQPESGGYIETKPTGPGGVLLLILVAMLIASINYGNNMAYIMCFLLTSLTMVTFLYTRNNVKGLEIINVLSHPVFAGETLRFSFELHNRTTGKRVSVYAAVYDQHTTDPADFFSGPFNVDSLSRTTGTVSIHVPDRGRFTLESITLLSLYPLGLFQVKYHIPVNKVYLVYPQPIGFQQWPEPEIHEEETTGNITNRGGDDFVGFRPYREGESQRHVDWKAVARGRPMNIKEFTGGGTEQLWFDYFHPEYPSTEKRLSQLARWVLEAEQLGKEFGMRLPGNIIKSDSGPGHTVKCFEALAMFSSSDSIGHSEINYKKQKTSKK